MALNWHHRIDTVAKCLTSIKHAKLHIVILCFQCTHNCIDLCKNYIWCGNHDLLIGLQSTIGVAWKYLIFNSYYQLFFYLSLGEADVFTFHLIKSQILIKIMPPTKCCCCFSLLTGSKIIGFFCTVYTIVISKLIKFYLS